MSEASEFIEKIYKLSEEFKNSEIEEYIDSKIDFYMNANKYDVVDSILYAIDLNKIRAFIAKWLIYKVNHFSEKLIMGKDFTERCVEHFGKDNI